MYVYGYGVPEQVIDACVKRMKEKPFQAYEIAGIAHELGSKINAAVLPNHIAPRIADRLIQKMRREKKIKMVAFPKWQWVNR